MGTDEDADFVAVSEGERLVLALAVLLSEALAISDGDGEADGDAVVDAPSEPDTEIVEEALGNVEAVTDTVALIDAMDDADFVGVVDVDGGTVALAESEVDDIALEEAGCVFVVVAEFDREVELLAVSVGVDVGDADCEVVGVVDADWLALCVGDSD